MWLDTPGHTQPAVLVFHNIFTLVMMSMQKMQDIVSFNIYWWSNNPVILLKEISLLSNYLIFRYELLFNYECPKHTQRYHWWIQTSLVVTGDAWTYPIKSSSLTSYFSMFNNSMLKFKKFILLPEILMPKESCNLIRQKHFCL